MLTCRACKQELCLTPLLELQNMPNAAQYFPSKNELMDDQAIELRVFQCEYCGLVQLSNNPVPYHREVIRAVGISNEMRLFRERQFTNFISQYDLTGKNVIEVGCGQGEYLEILQSCNVQAHGLEYSNSAVLRCLEKSLKVSRGYLDVEETVLPNAPYDAFFILNTFEHIPNPNEYLRNLHMNLTDDAYGMIEVPNFEAIIRERQLTEFTIEHLMYFTKDTLQFILNRNGFEILNCQEIWDGYILSANVRKREKMNFDAFLEEHEIFIKSINDYIEGFPVGQVAVWGAGHQANTVMAMANLKGKIPYVIDSAPFKQGKYTFVTHLPIVSPEILRQQSVEAVIIMGAGFSDEIAEVLKKNHPELSIAILRKTHLEIIK